jgi:glycosyltransferase involved in cell wall biosynthesis
MGKMKVVHLITRLELGGAQINTVYTYEHLDARRFEAYLACGPGGILTERVQKQERLVMIKDLVRELNPVRDLKALFQIMRFFKKVRPDIVHTHSSKAGILGRLACFLLGIPAAVHSVHGFSFSPYQSFFKRSFYRLAEKTVARMTDHFVFVSLDDIQAARHHRLIREAPKNYSLIRSGFPLKKFRGKAKDPAAVREKYRIKKDDFVCGTIAPFKPQKGLFHLVEIADLVLKKRKDVVFVIAGDGALRPDLETALRQRGIDDHFRLPGFLFDIEQFIDAFDLGVSTALWEGLPQSLVQLRLKQKPVVASDIPGNREVIKDNRNGCLVEVTNHEGFAEKILYLIDHPTERKRLAAHPEDFAAWDADFMVNTQERLYTTLIEESGKGKGR